MPSAPQPPRRSWRDDAAGAREGTNKRKWQKEPGTVSHGFQFTRRMKIVIASFMLLLVTGGVVWWLWLLHRNDPPRLVLIGAGYETNLTVPPNVYGKNSFGDFTKWADDYNKQHPGDREHAMDVRQEELTAEGGDPFEKNLKDCKSESVVVFVSVHGGASPAQGGAYLIPNNASPKNNRALYKMDKALAALSQLDGKTKKLLILDTTQMTADWDLGMLHNDFVRSLKSLLEAKKISNLVVFCASDEDQRSWVSEDYRRTIFAHYVMEGLRGAVKKDNDNGELTAQELIVYVQEKVENWVRHNRDDVQQPLVIDPEHVAKSMVIPSGNPKDYIATEPENLPAFKQPAKLTEAWEQRDALANSFPHPVTYTPHLWRQYHDALLRYEHLLRAGDELNAANLSQTLGKLVSDIRQSQRLEYAALTATLTMPTALGASLSDQDEQKLQKEFNTLWTAPASTPEDFGRMLKEWQDGINDPWLKQLGRIRVVAMLLTRATDANFQRVCKILPRVDDSLLPRRPAEAHFALMLQTHVPKENRTQMVASLSTRLHAEQAALGLPHLGGEKRALDKYTPYSEQLLPWIRDDMARADKARRLREDLLFASAKEETRLGAKLDDSDKLYSKVQEQASVVHTALHLRDQVLADFPYYSRWLAGKSLADLPPTEEKRWLDTWDNTHELCRLLDASNRDIEALKVQTNKIHFEELGVLFTEEYMLKTPSATPKNWHRLHELLSVPLIPAGYRSERLAELADVGQKLNIQTNKTAAQTGVTGVTGRGPQEAAQIQGRFALHLLGNKHSVSEAVDPIIARPGGDWQTSLGQAGDKLGEAFNDQIHKLYEDTDKSSSAPLDDAAPLLRAAAVKVRLAPGAAVAAWAGLDPVGENRRVQMYELMKWQGERTFADFWAAWTEDELRNPYYRAAADLYVTAAQALVTKGNSTLTPVQQAARVKGLAQLQVDLAASDQIELRWRDGKTYKAGRPDPLNITDEETVRRGFCLVCGPTTPDGFPVVWQNLDEKSILKPEKESDLEHHALDHIPRKPDEEPIEYTLRPERPAKLSFVKQQTKYGVQGFYRGRSFTQDTTVTLNNLPEIVSFAPQMPSSGRIALVASKEDYDRFAAENSELVIVVDYSGSMGGVDGHPEIIPRITRVLDALEVCLKKVPRGVKVTLLTFSLKGSDEDDCGVQVQWPKAPWDPATLKDKMDGLRHLTPFGNTPLVLATVEGLRQFTEGFSGAKTLLVLTDGGDNKYETRDAKTLKTDPKSMAQCLQKYFKKDDVALNVIGFETKNLQFNNPAEYKGLEQYKEAIKTINGVFLPVEQGEDLAKELGKQLLQIRFDIDEGSGKLPPGLKHAEGYPISANTSTGVKFWVQPLTPGTFNVVIQTNRLRREIVTQRVEVGGGESVVLKLARKPDKSGYYMTRETYADSETIKALRHEVPRQEIPRKDDNDKTWVLTVPQNQVIDNKVTVDGLQMMVSLEERDAKPIGPKNLVTTTWPHFVWFRTSIPGEVNKTVPGLRFFPLANYPAPCYRLDYLHWPDRAAPKLDIWWNDRKLPEGDVVIPENDQPVTQLIEQPVTVQSKVVVESVVQQKLPLVLQPDDKAPTKVDCLIVRLRYPPDQGPFFVQLPQGKYDGAEHRFYTEAGKYTGIFWNVSETTVKELKSLTVYSVAGVLKEAHHVGPLDLKVPNTFGPPQLEDGMK